MARRNYTEDDKASALAALDANSGDVWRTAKQLGIQYNTLLRWVQKRGPVPLTVPAQTSDAVAQQLRSEKKASLADRLEDIAYKLLDDIPNKLADADLKQVAVALGIAIDKMQLLRGEPTSITNTNLTDEQRADGLRELAERIRQRRAGAADAGRAPIIPSVN